MKEKSFEDEVIPSLSDSLTLRFMEVLQPILPEELEEQAIRALRRSVNCIFKLAIKLRVETLVSRDSFTIIWPTIGSNFYSDEMELKPSEKNRTMRIKLPICPGLRARSIKKTRIHHGGLKIENWKKDSRYVIKALVIE